MKPLIAEILNHPTDFLALANPEDLTLLACNSNLERHLNISPGLYLGKNIYEALGKFVPREKMKDVLATLHKTRFYIDKETDPDNHVFLNLVNCEQENCCVIRLSSQKINHVLQQYEHLFEKNLAGVYKADFGGNLLSCNKAFANILGYDDAKELIGKNTKSFYRNKTLRDQYLAQLAVNQVLVNFELELLRKDGTTAYCLENAYRDRVSDGKDVVSGTVIDISAKRDIEVALQESEERFRAISSVSNEGVVFSNNGIVADCNDQFARLLGYPSSAHVIGRELSEFIKTGDIHRINTSIGISSANRTEIRIRNNEGKLIFLEITGSYLPYRGVPTLAMVADDVSTRKRAEQSLQQSAVSFRRLLENSPNGVVILTGDKIKYLNKSACELLGIEDEDELYDKSLLPFVKTEMRQEIKHDFEDIRDGLEIEYKEVLINRKQGEAVDVGIKSILTVYENMPSIQVTLNNVSVRNQLMQEQIRGRLSEDINTALKAEIAEHKTTQQNLERERRNATEQKAKLESIFNSTENLMMWTINAEFIITATNINFVVWMNQFYKEKVNVGDNIMTLLERHLDEDFYQGQLKAFDAGFKGKPQQFEFALKNSDNETTWLQAFLNPVYMEGKLEELSCLLYDNTERKEFDKKVRDSLKEKEVLLQEVHHRVKNNLQVISSILNLQASYIKDQKTIEVLKESQTRIKSMSYLHETIYRTADFSKLEFTDYLRSIISNLMQSYRSQDEKIELIDNMDIVYLGIDESIPCGLIVNELVSNALKYAFKENKEGRVTITLSEKDGHIALEIKDNGSGLPKDFSYEKNNSLGIQLVYALLEQLDAKMEVHNENGASFLITFQRKL